LNSAAAAAAQPEAEPEAGAEAESEEEEVVPDAPTCFSIAFPTMRAMISAEEELSRAPPCGKEHVASV
jgi:hypothetical protein